jgi:hypothetical protein
MTTNNDAVRLIGVATRDSLPFSILSALLTVSLLDRDAVLAGGAVRDTLNNKPVKDIDIFVGPAVTVEDLRKFDDGLQWTSQFSASTVEAYKQFFGDELVEVIKGYDPNSISTPQVQVIVMKQPVTLASALSSADFGFCQVGLQRNSLGIFATQAFMDDQLNNTATLTRSRRHKNFERSFDRASRLREKYPERTFLDDCGNIIFPPLPEDRVVVPWDTFKPLAHAV